MPETFLPSRDMVLVLPDVDTGCTDSGLFLPDLSGHVGKIKPVTGRVIAVGPGRRDRKGVRHPVQMSVGDTVLYLDRGFVPLRLNEMKYALLREEQIAAVVE